MMSLSRRSDEVAKAEGILLEQKSYLFDRIKQMKRGLWAVVVSLWVAALGAQQDAINRYCVTCHSDRLKTSGLSLEKADVAHPALDPDLGEKVARKLQARSMPPQTSRRP